MTDEEWITHLNNIEPILFTNCSYYTDGYLKKERIRSYWETINGVVVRVALDYDEIQWVAINFPLQKVIKNPKSIFLQ